MSFSFSSMPRVDISRSVLPRPCDLKTTFNAGDLVPIYVEDVLPGDTVSFDMSSVVRMATPLHPVMDNAYVDIHAFFVPNRLVWEHWVNFMGENTDGPWVDETVYTVPQWNVAPSFGGLADHLGIPPGMLEDGQTFSINALQMRQYRLIWSEWYRDQNTQAPVFVNTGDTEAEDSVNPQDQLLKVNRYRDYFSSAAPQPQKGIATTLSLSSSPVPVNTMDQVHPVTNAAMTWRSRSGTPPVSTGSNVLLGLSVTGTSYTNTVVGSSSSSELAGLGVVPNNLFADLSGVSSVTVNALRQAFAVQRLLEADLYGTRYREIVLSHFGVHTGDARVQVPEYLGGKHIPINVQQVVQQSSTSGEPSVLGNTGAFSKTVDRNHFFTKSFVEHGTLMVLASVRVDHSYQQGINKRYLRKNRFDYYFPELANIGEQPVMSQEIYATSDPGLVFGYQEAFADYRYSPNRVSGAMRSNSPVSLDVWHYADDYASRPMLSSAWMKESDVNIGRTLAVTDSSVADQFIAHFFFNPTWVRPMPVHSVPGLTGHF